MSVARRIVGSRAFCALALLAVASTAHASTAVVAGLSASSGWEFGVPAPRPNWVVGSRIGATSAEVDTLVPTGAMGMVGGPGFSPRGAAADAHGRFVYRQGAGGIWVIDSTGQSAPAVMDLGGLPVYRIAADPSGARLFGLIVQPGYALVTIDLRARKVVDSVTLLEGGSDLVVSPDGHTVWVLGSSNMVSRIDVRSHALLRGQVPGLHARAIALDAARGKLLVAKDFEQRIDVLSAEALEFDRSFPLADSPYEIVFNAAADLLYVQGQNLSALDPASGAAIASSSSGGSGVMPSPDGSVIYRVVSGTCGAGELYSSGCSSARLQALDARTLAKVGEGMLDTRERSDPSWTQYHAVANFIVAAPKVTYAVEYYNAPLDHYFVTAFPAEIERLDRGDFIGWQRTGESIPVYLNHDDGPGGTTPVCRFYGRPDKGLNSHFYSPSPTECAEVLARFGDSWILEAGDVFHAYLPDAATGACPFDTTPVYRLYNNRGDVNHRYAVSSAIRDAMLAQGWIVEGYGPNAIGFCVPR